MGTEFIAWLIEEMEQRGWSNSELARRAQVVPSTVSMIVSGQKRPGLDFCLGVARALQLPPETVLRKAGLLPPVAEDRAKTDELLHYFRGLDEGDQQRVITITRALHEARVGYKTEGTEGKEEHDKA